MTSDTIIKTAGLEKIYRLGRILVPALRGADLEVSPGECVSIMGPSGCGKSTLLHILGGMLRATAGGVLVDGENLAILPERRLNEYRRKKIGFVFQKFNLLPTLSAALNLRVAQKVRGLPADGIAEILDRVGLKGKERRRPSELSMGEQQRLAIARALIHRPLILLSDEPTGNLDSATARAILDLLKEIREERGQTLLIVTHDPGVAEEADRVLHMLDGTILP